MAAKKNPKASQATAKQAGKGKAKPATAAEPVTAAATADKPRAKAKVKTGTAAETTPAAATTAPQVAATKPAGAAVDAFGSRLGSKAAKVNACLTKEPKPMQQLMQEAGMDQTFYNHLNKLAGAGKVAKTDQGYCVA